MLSLSPSLSSLTAFSIIEASVRGAAALEGAHEAVRKKINLMVAATLCRGQSRPTTEPDPSSSPPPDDRRRKPIPFLTSCLPPSLDLPNHSPSFPPFTPPPSLFHIL